MLSTEVVLSLAMCRVTMLIRNWLEKASPSLNDILEPLVMQLTVVPASATSHMHTRSP